ncbi:MAG: sensor protein [Sphingobacteriales bacterium]|nr:sensor protein [Sphingobacteriales bacterium]
MTQYQPYKIVLVYCLFSTCWIYFSDKLLNLLSSRLSLDLSIHQTFKGLFFVIFTSILLYQLIKKHQQYLTESANQYKAIFFANPNPMWIYNIESLRIIEVNNAAIEKYGYSKTDFLTMSVLDFKSEEDREELKKKSGNLSKKYNLSGYLNHQKKSGDTIMVNIESHKLLFNKQSCVIVMASDVTARVTQEGKMIKQNKMLREIAWQNSHAIRKPLCNILSIIALFKSAENHSEILDFIPLLEESATELDENIIGLGIKINQAESVQVT